MKLTQIITGIIDWGRRVQFLYQMAGLALATSTGEFVRSYLIAHTHIDPIWRPPLYILAFALSLLLFGSIGPRWIKKKQENGTSKSPNQPPSRLEIISARYGTDEGPDIEVAEQYLRPRITGDSLVGWVGADLFGAYQPVIGPKRLKVRYSFDGKEATLTRPDNTMLVLPEDSYLMAQNASMSQPKTAAPVPAAPKPVDLRGEILELYFDQTGIPELNSRIFILLKMRIVNHGSDQASITRWKLRVVVGEDSPVLADLILIPKNWRIKRRKTEFLNIEYFEEFIDVRLNELPPGSTLQKGVSWVGWIAFERYGFELLEFPNGRFEVIVEDSFGAIHVIQRHPLLYRRSGELLTSNGNATPIPI